MDNNLLPEDYILVERYKIVKKLGQGGFGITYLANDLKLDNLVCVKELYVSGNSTRGENFTVNSQTINDISFGEFKTKFIAEAKQLAKFNHSNIVKVTDVLEANKTAYYVMEFLEGITLKEYVQKNGAFDIQTLMPIVEKLLSAADEIHRKGMLHRDIKPDNIIFKPNGNVVLIDFGSAREFGEGKTITQTAMLTPGYAPLEQYSEKSKRGVFSDIYALGATLYFLITGEKPIPATDRVLEKLKSPHELNTLITKQVSSAIMLAMEMKPEDRFQSIADFRMALKDVASIPIETLKPKDKVSEKLIEDKKVEKNKQKNKQKKAIPYLLILFIPTILFVGYLFFFNKATIIKDNEYYKNLFLDYHTFLINDQLDATMNMFEDNVYYFKKMRSKSEIEKLQKDYMKKWAAENAHVYSFERDNKEGLFLYKIYYSINRKSDYKKFAYYIEGEIKFDENDKIILLNDIITEKQ